MEGGFALALFALAVYGLANAMAVLKIGQFMFGKSVCIETDCPHPRHPYELRKSLGRIPKIGDLFYCPPCLAFWIGMAASWWLFSPSSLLIPRGWRTTILDGLMASGMTYILHVWMEYLGKDLDL